ncbi:MAG: 3'(2'),5'-bisphosphate nucleotidase [Ilumatobacter sp.]|uniref:3'(2'),5'-bisphosphate nucleotidase n=1 Tax=Ilumatobacter sp. TaxID=1967498 RepID=UPI003918F4D3
MSELDDVVGVAVAAVQAASAVTSAAQGRLASGSTLTKGDDSPVTVADFAAQAIVCRVLADAFGSVAVVGEETPDDLADRPELLAGVTSLVRGASVPGAETLSDADVLAAIALGGADASAGGRYWTLDPIDGTKGFLRGDQYAIALALVDDGEVVLGVLGCPNLVNPDGSRGAVLVGVDGAATISTGRQREGGAAWGPPVPIRVDSPEMLAQARLCESVESGHSDQGQSAEIARRLGIVSEPYRIDSQCKYAAVGRGDASIYLRLPTRADYVEKIWDHAAGKFIVECAGGVVTDVAGSPLDFGQGARLEANRGVVATSGRFHDDVLAAVSAVIDA